MTLHTSSSLFCLCIGSEVSRGQATAVCVRLSVVLDLDSFCLTGKEQAAQAPEEAVCRGRRRARSAEGGTFERRLSCTPRRDVLLV